MSADDLFQSLVEAVTMTTEPLAEPPQQPPETVIMTSKGVKLEEKLWVDECYLFQDESLAPIFCKSKLIPLKTITTQKLEQMQKEQMEKVQPPEPTSPATIEEVEEREDVPTTSDGKDADVWTADD